MTSYIKALCRTTHRPGFSCVCHEGLLSNYWITTGRPTFKLPVLERPRFLDPQRERLLRLDLSADVSFGIARIIISVQVLVIVTPNTDVVIEGIKLYRYM